MTDKYYLTTDKWGDVPDYPLFWDEIMDLVSDLRALGPDWANISVAQVGADLVDETGAIVGELDCPPEVK